MALLEELVYRDEIADRLTIAQADNNIRLLAEATKKENLYIPVTIADTDDLTAIAGKINALASFEILENQLPKFRCTTVPGAENPRNALVELKNLGPGMYGAGGYTLSVADLEYISDGAAASVVIDQDNITIRKTYIMPVDYTQSDVVDMVNDSALFTRTDIQSLLLITPAMVPGGFSFTQTKLWIVINKGKGTYGDGGTIELGVGDIQWLADITPSADDIETDPATQTVNYGAIVSPATVASWLTAKNPALVIQEQTTGIRLFKGTVDGVAANYIFIGAGGAYGVGNLPAIMADFEVYEQGTTPGVPLGLSDITPNGNTTPDELISTNETEAAALKPDGSIGFKNNAHELIVKPTAITANKQFNIDGSKADGDTFSMLTDVYGLTLASNPAASEIYLKNAAGTTLATLNVAFLNNEGTTFYYNSATGNLELKNDQGTVLSVIPVSAFVTNIVHSAAFNGATPSNLEFKDTTGAVLFTVPFAVNNISGLQAALDARLTGTQGVDADFQVTTEPTTGGKFLDNLRLFRWWAWVKGQAATISATWTFSTSPLVPTATYTDNTTKAASTAFVQAAINGQNLNLKYARSFGDIGSHLSTTTASVPIYTVDIPAVAMQDGCVFEIVGIGTSTGTAGIKYLRHYMVPLSSYNSSNPFSGAQLIALTPLDNSSSSTITGQFDRMGIISGGNMLIYPVSSPVLRPSSSTQALSPIPVTLNVPYKYFIAGQITVSTDTLWVQTLKIQSIANNA
jgi:hypothetical protein